MSVDNASVAGMDFSELVIDNPDLYFVQWIEGKGELERQEIIDGSGDGDNNLNGLRETFIDILPYCPIFQQFLTRMKEKALLLPQAKKVQVELIGEVFNAKRQAPFHYPVAAGDYWWDATDATLFSSLVPATQNAIAKVNEVIGKLNSAFPSITNQINTGAVNPGDILTAQVNANVVNQGNVVRNELTSVIQTAIAVLVNEINGSIINYINSNASTLSGACFSSPIIEDGGTATAVAKPGLGAALLQAPALGTSAGAPSNSFLSTNADFLTATNPWPNTSNVVQSNTSWIPVGGTAPVTVTPTEAAGIMQGIAARTNDLNVKKNTKIGQVNALTTVDAVIAYDVTTGW
jgi:hypothetical protein